MSRQTVDSLISRAFMALLSVVLTLAVGFLRDLNRSVNELNTRVAVIIEQTTTQQSINSNIESRLERLERKGSRIPKE